MLSAAFMASCVTYRWPPCRDQVAALYPHSSPITHEQLRMNGLPKISTAMMVANVRKPRPTNSAEPY